MAYEKNTHNRDRSIPSFSDTPVADGEGGSGHRTALRREAPLEVSLYVKGLAVKWSIYSGKTRLLGFKTEQDARNFLSKYLCSCSPSEIKGGAGNQ